MKIVKKNVERDADGNILGVREIVIENRDIAHRAAERAHRCVGVAWAQMVAADQAGDPDTRDEMMGIADDWALTRAVARGEYPGAVHVDDKGEVIGCSVETRPTIKVTGPAA